MNNPCALKKTTLKKNSSKERQRAMKLLENSDHRESNKKLLETECSLKCKGRSKPFKAIRKRPNIP
jgi:hypothetical protein